MLALLAFTGHRRCRWAEVNSDKFTEVWIQFVESLPKGLTLCGESFSFINIVISSLITLLGEPGPSKVPQKKLIPGDVILIVRTFVSFPGLALCFHF